MTPTDREQYGQTYPMYALQVPSESQIAISYAPWPVLLELQDILKQAH